MKHIIITLSVLTTLGAASAIAQSKIVETTEVDKPAMELRVDDVVIGDELTVSLRGQDPLADEADLVLDYTSPAYDD